MIKLDQASMNGMSDLAKCIQDIILLVTRCEEEQDDKEYQCDDDTNAVADKDRSSEVLNILVDREYREQDSNDKSDEREIAEYAIPEEL